MIISLSMDIGYNNATLTTDILIDHFILLTCAIFAITKIMLIRLHRDDLLKNLYHAESDWTNIIRQDHRQVMFRYTNLGRFVFYFQIICMYFCVSQLIVGPPLSSMMLSSSQNITLTAKSEKEMRAVELPFEMICPFDTPIVCYSIYIFQSVQMIGTGTGNVGSDVFFFGVCMHLCGQLEVLGLELLRFHEKNDGSWKRSKMRLIERHCLLLNLAKDIVDTLDIILIVQVIFQAALICLIGN